MARATRFEETPRDPRNPGSAASAHLDVTASAKILRSIQRATEGILDAGHARVAECSTAEYPSRVGLSQHSLVSHRGAEGGRRGGGQGGAWCTVRALPASASRPCAGQGA